MVDVNGASSDGFVGNSAIHDVHKTKKGFAIRKSLCRSVVAHVLVENKPSNSSGRESSEADGSVDRSLELSKFMVMSAVGC